MIACRRWLAFVAMATLAIARPARSQSPPPTLSVVFLYDFTTSVSTSLYGWSYSVAEDPVLEDFTAAVLAGINSGDSLSFGFITRRLYLSRPYAGHELDNFYRAVVQNTAVQNVDRVGSSPVWDALETATATLASAPGRRAILVVTDGQSTGNVHGRDEVLAHANAAHVAIYPIFLGDRRLLSPDWPTHPGDTLAAIADATRGTYTVIKEVKIYTISRLSSPGDRSVEAGTRYLPDPMPHAKATSSGPSRNFPPATIAAPVAQIFAALRR